MSSTINEFESETDFNNQKITENCNYNADSPLQFFEDNEPFIPSVNNNGLDSYTQNFKFSPDILMHENGNFSTNSVKMHVHQIVSETEEINTSNNKEIIIEQMDVDISNRNIDEIQSHAIDINKEVPDVEAQLIFSNAILNDINFQSNSAEIINEIPAVEAKIISSDPILNDTNFQSNSAEIVNDKPAEEAQGVSSDTILNDIKFEKMQNSQEIVAEEIVMNVKVESDAISNEIVFSDAPVTNGNELLEIHSYASKRESTISEDIISPQSSSDNLASSIVKNVDMDSEPTNATVTDVEISKVEEKLNEENCKATEQMTTREVSKEESVEGNKVKDQETSNAADLDVQVDDKPKSKRGRKSKVKAEISNISMEEETPRKRGRPRKIFQSENETETPLKSDKKRGRPRKTLPLSENNESEIVAETPMKEDRKRGRPRKSLTLKEKVPMSENHTEDDDWEPKTKMRRESDAEVDTTSLTKRRLSSRLVKIAAARVEYEDEASELDRSNLEGKRKRLSTKLIKRESIDIDVGESGYGKSARVRRLTMQAQTLGPLNIEDPGTWPTQLTPEVTLDVIKRGPVQVEGIDFPRNKRRKCFSVNNYLVKNNDGIKFRRNWLVYSRSRDAAYCYPCRIFSNDSSASLASFGCSNWKKIQDRLTVHDNSLKHSDCVAKWTEFAIANDCPNSCSSLTTYEALKLAEKVKQFSALKENKLYLLAQQLESELQAMLTQETSGDN